MSGVPVLQWLIFFISALPAIVLHEISHGYVAYLLGDPTAKNAGRLSLNPIRHIDPFGTLLLPAILSFVGHPWGYAKPVPINPYFFKDHRQGMLLTGLAGPATNLLLGVVTGLVVRIAPVQLGTGPFGAGYSVVINYLYFFAYVNFILMFFNLIPIPPFDGSRVIPILLTDNGLRIYAQIERYGFLIIMLVIFAAPGLLNAYFALTVEPLFRLVVGG